MGRPCTALAHTALGATREETGPGSHTNFCGKGTEKRECNNLQGHKAKTGMAINQGRVAENGGCPWGKGTPQAHAGMGAFFCLLTRRVS